MLRSHIYFFVLVNIDEKRESWSPPQRKLTLPKTFGTNVSTYPVEVNKARIHQPTKSFEEHVANRTGNVRDQEDRQRRLQQIEIEHRKLDENWSVPIGVKRSEEQAPTRFSVTPKQKSQDFLFGSEGTSFHEADSVSFL